MLRPAALALFLLPTAAGCVYYNSIYNAEQALAEADELRLAGRPDAHLLYESALRKAAEGYRKDPGGEWADEALLISGRAALELGDLARAERLLAAAVEAARSSGDETTELEAAVYLAAALERQGRWRPALELLASSVGRLAPGDALAAGHLARARIRLERGSTEGGERDLYTAAAVSREAARRAALLRLELAIERGRRDWALEAVDDLLADRDASVSAAALVELLERGAREPHMAAALSRIAEARETSWPPAPRDRLRLAAARQLHAAGLAEEALSVAGELALAGEASDEARRWMAELHLAEAADPDRLAAVRDLLRPAADAPEAAALSARIDAVLFLVEESERDPVALFAAAEMARDALGAHRLARGLFIAFSDLDPSGPWAGKSLLAALDLSDGSEARSEIRLRMRSLGADPYLRAAQGREAGAELEPLEEALTRRMRLLGAGSGSEAPPEAGGGSEQPPEARSARGLPGPTPRRNARCRRQGANGPRGAAGEPSRAPPTPRPTAASGCRASPSEA